MFWIIVSLILAFLFFNLPLPAFIALVVLSFISTASVVVASNLVIGKVSFANAFKANTLGSLTFFVILVFTTLGQVLGPTAILCILAMAFFAMLFVFSNYLGATIPNALVILILAGLVNAGGLFVLGSTAGLGLDLADSVPGGFFKTKIVSSEQFVERMNLDKSFYRTSLQAAKSTKQYKNVALKLGEKTASKILEKQVKKTTSLRQSKWNENFTQSYLYYFSEEELISIANDREDSPYSAKFKEKQTAVSKRMRKLSYQLINDTVNEALDGVLREAPS